MLCFINHLLQLFPVGDPSCLPTTTTTTTTTTEKTTQTGSPQTTRSPAASQTTIISTTLDICGKPERAGDHRLQFDISSTISGYEFDQSYNNKESSIYKSITQHLKSQVRVF